MLAVMPRREAAKGREENEVEFSRIVAFSDGVFAIAITLLVLELNIPDTLSGHDAVWNWIWDEREKFLAFAISFAVIGRFWIVHHRFFSEVRAFDNALLSLNLLYLGTIVLIPFSSQVLGEYGGETTSVVVYAANLAAVILVGFWMMNRAHRAGLTNADAEARREGAVRAGYIAAVFLASIPVAFLAPSLAQLMWLVLFFDPADHLSRRGP
jgi:uncharacterized membrane protein